MRSRIERWITVAAFLVLVSLFSAGCVKNRTLSPSERMLPSYPITKSVALAKLEQMSKSIQSLTAAVTMEAKIGGLKSAAEKTYPTFPGTLLYKKPNEIRIRATYLTFGAFDMVSNGNTYEVLAQNKLFKGLEEGPPVGAIFPDPKHNLLAELRPRQITSAMLIDVMPYLTNPQFKNYVSTVSIQADRRLYYIVDFFDDSSKEPQLFERIWFDLSTSTLDISRRQTFSKDGIVETDARFSGWKPIGSGTVSLPSVVNIQFPEKDLSVKLTIDSDSLSVNSDIPKENFQLPPHPNAEVIVLEPKQVLISK